MDIEDLTKKRPDSPQIRRKSWPSAPRSILKKRPIPQKSAEISESESGLGNSSALSENNKDIIEVVVNNNEEKIDKIQDEGNSANSNSVISARAVRKRRIAGIFQHYYPEGGWGYVILIVAFLSCVLANGIQFGFLVLMPFAARRYRADQLEVGKRQFLTFQSFTFLLLYFTLF